MQLKKIKLAGFKSFVDPTIIPVPGQLTAIVGPNGCGKSNVIDATCWVMGESSAKYLRGESLTDVIFNGSSARKPVGQASVELVFDNQDGSLGGEYSAYSEISIKRQITREGDSNYYLNGTRCRRRDIIDIFLGTGLGPRSYSIIGQNMISRIIEAKPDEMRIYLEEAAGVSKYKERRRETENRINHTKENLARLNDIRIELDKQLGSLKRQATAAEKFKLLKQEERTCRGQYLVIQWRDLDHQLVHITLQIQQQETSLEAKQADIVHLNLQLEGHRELLRSNQEIQQDIQRRYYSIGNEITRIEQEIRHARDKKQQWQHDIEQTQQDEISTTQTLEESRYELAELKTELEQLQPEFDTTKKQAERSALELKQADEAMHIWQMQWDEFNQRVSQTTQTAQVEQTRIQHLEQRLATIKQNQSKLMAEQNQVSIEHLENELVELTHQIEMISNEKQTQDEQITQIRQDISTLQTAQRTTHQQLDQTRSQLQKLKGKQSSLEALQQTALGQKNDRVIQWLTKHNLDKQPRLAQGLEVESGWEYAVEKVLGHHLQALCVSHFEETATLVQNEFKTGSICLFATENTTSSEIKENSLLSKVKSHFSLASLLGGIYIAENEIDALKLCESLATHESVITREGIWLSKSWLRVSRDDDASAGIFQREQELKLIEKQIQEFIQKQNSLEETILEEVEQLKTLESKRDELQRIIQQTHAKAAESNARHKMQEHRLIELNTRAAKVKSELEESIEQIEETQRQLIEARAVWQHAMTQLEIDAKQRDQFNLDRETLRNQLQVCREQLSQTKEAAHQHEIRIQTTQSKHSSLLQTEKRLVVQLNSLVERKTQLQKELSSLCNIEELEQLLEVSLGQRLEIEKEMQEIREIVAANEQELRQFESKRQEIEREIVKVRDILETLRVENQGYKVKSESLQQQVQELGFELTEILQQLPEQTDINEWQAQLEQLTQRISRLGAINLVAIEEYASCTERKDYLDKQFNDLQEGLTTLENAIDKIDKETRARFKETFDKVNNHFQELFPTIFGGGRASLELTGDNLLDAGITVMACPPGKRNSTIHLLSGGEKALTAISLVFSIFQLNPAPFCLLDEVDAPLDDANVARFCQLVKTMSQKTQFIFISHNKLAIEMAEHLIGVTMHEPGVSRLVSVNVEEAVSMATEG